MPDSTTLQPPAEPVTNQNVGDAIVAPPQVDSPPPAAPAEPAAPQYATPVHEELARHGFDVGRYPDAGSLAQDFLHLQGTAARYQEIAPHLQEFEQWRQSRATAQPAAAPAADAPPEWKAEEHFSKAWGAPKFDPMWQEAAQKGLVLRDDATGLLVVNPKYVGQVPPSVVDDMNRFEQWKKPAYQGFMQNPYEKTWGAFQEPLKRTIADEFRGLMAQHWEAIQTQAVRQQFETANANWLFASQKVQENGKAVDKFVTDAQGNRQLSPFGSRWVQHYQYYRQFMPEQQAIMEAQFRLQGEIAQAQQAAPPAPAASPPAAPEQQSFMANALARAGATVNGHSSPSNDTPAANWGDLGSVILPPATGA